MNIILTAPSGRRWKISPVDNGLCYLISKQPVRKTGRNGKPIKSEWISCERYPSGIQHAVSSCIEMMMCDPDDNSTIEVDNLDLLNQALRLFAEKISYEIDASVRSVRASAKRSK